jgi:hypothetical protein
MADELRHSQRGDEFLMDDAEDGPDRNTGDADMEVDNERCDASSSAASSDNESGFSSSSSMTNPPPGLFHLPPPPERTYDSLVLAEKAMHGWSKKHGYEGRKEMDTKTSTNRRTDGSFRPVDRRLEPLGNKRKLTDAQHILARRAAKRIGCEMGLILIVKNISKLENCCPGGLIRHQRNNRSNCFLRLGHFILCTLYR